MLTVAIQAGGESRRMGYNKALIPFMGQTLIERIYQRLIPLGDEIIVTTNQPEDYPFLSLPLIADLQPGCGALGGLYTALSAARHALVAVVACDMPFVNPSLLAAQMELLIRLGCDAVLPQTNYGLEPFHAVYRRDPCREAIDLALQSGQRRADSWLAQVQMCTISLAEIQQYDPQGLAFLNINSPEDLAAAERIARVIEQR